MSGTTDAVHLAMPVPEDEANPNPGAEGPYVQMLMQMIQNMMRQHSEEMAALKKEFEEKTKSMQEA